MTNYAVMRLMDKDELDDLKKSVDHIRIHCEAFQARMHSSKFTAEDAKQFYEDAYEAAKEIVGGEQYILSAVMHADERNRAMSEALGQDVFHYHMHVVYVPVVEKQVLWTKQCKDPSLVGTVKETITQVSSSKKWLSKPALDEQGNPILQKNGKPVLKKSYSVLQDDFYNAMRAKGYTDVERGERGSTEEHLDRDTVQSSAGTEAAGGPERQGGKTGTNAPSNGGSNQGPEKDHYHLR